MLGFCVIVVDICGGKFLDRWVVGLFLGFVWDFNIFMICKKEEKVFKIFFYFIVVKMLISFCFLDRFFICFVFCYYFVGYEYLVRSEELIDLSFCMWNFIKCELWNCWGLSMWSVRCFSVEGDLFRDWLIYMWNM